MKLIEKMKINYDTMERQFVWIPGTPLNCLRPQSSWIQTKNKIAYKFDEVGCLYDLFTNMYKGTLFSNEIFKLQMDCGGIYLEDYNGYVYEGFDCDLCNMSHVSECITMSADDKGYYANHNIKEVEEFLDSFSGEGLDSLHKISLAKKLMK